jgi:glycerol-3-phosphate dehydrogenase (NAD(P)+)
MMFYEEHQTENSSGPNPRRYPFRDKSQMKQTSITVIGGGGWGTCLARHLAQKGHSTSLWVFEPELAKEMSESRENKIYLPGVSLPTSLAITSSLEEACDKGDLLLLATPSQVMRKVLGAMRPYLLHRRPSFVSATKGIEQQTLALPFQMIFETFPDLDPARVAVLSGPSFARELALSQPTAVSLAASDHRFAVRLQKLFTTSYFRLFITSDLLGVQIGGALKNVIALAAGGSDGLGFGSNAKAALITRGLTEMMRLGIAVGADPKTFFGLSGLGDLVLTCTGQLSRNWQVGYQIGRGKTLDEVLQGMRMVAEGVETTRSSFALAKKHGVDMPIIEQIHQVLFEGKSPREAVLQLMEEARGDEVPAEVQQYFDRGKKP